MSKIGLIIQREYNQRVRKKTFILTTILTPLAFLSMMFVPVLIAMYDGGSQRQVVVIDKSGVVAPQLVDNENVKYNLTDGSYPEVVDKFKDAYGFLVIDSDVVANASKMTLHTRETSTIDLENQIKNSVSKVVENLRIKESGVQGIDSMLAYFDVRVPLQTFTIGENVANSKASSSTFSMSVAYVSGFIIYMFIFLYGAMVMQGVIEEKSNRIIEVIVSSVKPFELMMGKILGIALVALTQVLIWVVIAIIGMVALNGIFSQNDIVEGAAMAQGMPSELQSMTSVLSDIGYLFGVVLAFIVFFIGGYLLYASMFAAVGSAVDNAADTQQLQVPLTIPLILAIFVMISTMRDPNSAMAFWFSIIPFTSPIVMMTRVAYGVPFWELCLSVALLYGTFVVMTLFAAKIYRVGIFMYGKKPSFKELLKWSKYKS